MKRLIMAVAILSIVMLNACTHQLSAAKVPAEVKAAFADKFPGATATWRKENASEYEAEFNYNGKSASANFLKDGSWVETEMEIAITELPAAVATGVHNRYPGATILKVYKIDNAKAEQTYEAEIKDGNKNRELDLKADGSLVK